MLKEKDIRNDKCMEIIELWFSSKIFNIEKKYSWS